MFAPPSKMNRVFFFIAVTTAYLMSGASQAQQSPRWEPTSRKLDLKDMVKLGDVYVRRADPNRPKEPDTWALEVGGQRSFWDKYAHMIVADYLSSKLDLEYV